MARRLIAEIEAASDVMVHIDPVDDEEFTPNHLLPLREKVLARLDTLFKSIVVADRIHWVNLHYLGGKIRIDVVLPLSLFQRIIWRMS
ncbi:MAG: hypothetical protein GY731_07915 [Gammaproteobacteria bacterium]|nr:hypothetical protein [Gammaproteobacteria bacterium]